MNEIIEGLKKYKWYREQIVHLKVIQAKAGGYGEVSPPLSPSLQNYLTSKGIKKLYSHQAESIKKIREGINLIITTGTASGKTLCFNLPIIEKLEEDKKATALYLYPLKALTNDQLKVLKEMTRFLETKLEPAIYDGDTPKERRASIREKSRIILSNPYELHQVLPYHYKWENFLKNLKFVVIDEAHRYKGVLGSNFALLIRRFLAICEVYGSSPQFILSSASIANPIEFAEKLTSKSFELIDEDGSPRGRKFFLFWNPSKYKERSVHVQTKDLLVHSVKNNLQTLCFVVSRRLSELISFWIKNEEPKLRISSYRAGYLPLERREIERKLRQKELEGVVSTTALELGIDIGGLDCVIISGDPGTIASFFQQGGRAGRKTQDSLVIFVGFEDALDQYLLKHPEVLLSGNFENAVIDLSNPYILSGHILCAASELPIKKDNYKSLGPITREILESLQKENLVRETPEGFIYCGKERPQQVVSLDNISSQQVKVVCEDQILETLDLQRDYAAAHTGAVLIHRGESYIVEELDLKNLKAKVKKEEVDYFTESIDIDEVKIIEEEERKVFRDFSLFLGKVEVQDKYIGYKIKKYEQVVNFVQLDLPQVIFQTMGLWFDLPVHLRNECEFRGLDFAGGMHAVEHAMISISPLSAMCDRRDLGGVSYSFYPETGKALIFIYDAYEGGIGISEKLFETFKALVQMTHNLIKDCECEEGCPACILSSKCGNNNRPMDKEAALYILENMLKNMSNVE
ncbi:MAG: DEAD/DEAH box helicase [candidate division Zixibacteria bacterium]|nr:DEAD/DEAH box helicase [candidate division Zixibacteria bacterium]